VIPHNWIQNYFFGPLGFGPVVFLLSCLFVQLLFGPAVYDRLVKVELSFG
jgi:hypothetical protein